MKGFWIFGLIGTFGIWIYSWAPPSNWTSVGLAAGIICFLGAVSSLSEYILKKLEKKK